MTDPNQDKQEATSAENAGPETQEDAKAHANWDKHQQIDEEGNEVKPEDV